MGHTRYSDPYTLAELMSKAPLRKLTCTKLFSNQPRGPYIKYEKRVIINKLYKQDKSLSEIAATVELAQWKVFYVLHSFIGTPKE